MFFDMYKTLREIYEFHSFMKQYAVFLFPDNLDIDESIIVYSKGSAYPQFVSSGKRVLLSKFKPNELFDAICENDKAQSLLATLIQHNINDIKFIQKVSCVQLLTSVDVPLTVNTECLINIFERIDNEEADICNTFFDNVINDDKYNISISQVEEYHAKYSPKYYEMYINIIVPAVELLKTVGRKFMKNEYDPLTYDFTSHKLQFCVYLYMSIPATIESFGIPLLNKKYCSDDDIYTQNIDVLLDKSVAERERVIEKDESNVEFITNHSEVFDPSHYYQIHRVHNKLSYLRVDGYDFVKFEDEIVSIQWKTIYQFCYDMSACQKHVTALPIHVDEWEKHIPDVCCLIIPPNPIRKNGSNDIRDFRKEVKNPVLINIPFQNSSIPL